ncbi:MAG: alpha-glucan family phosphorylase [Bacteroidales bacterium]
MSKTMTKPNYIFEVSWEVCNKVGGIHTVVATKASTLVKEYQNNYIVIGPDVIHDETGNPEFVEDAQLFASWRSHIATEGLRIKIGRWSINSHPIAILIDFSNMINQKDKIFSELWETYKLDSLSGQWDYMEPALFGYTAGKVIESFVKFNLTSSDRVVAQFHEWMTGAGVLYLKSKLPQVANVFTTHATVLGRCLAGNNRQLYKNLENYNEDEVAKEFNLVSKQSLEKLSAQNSDAFTTVSEITARECTQFLKRSVDVVTPNGFEDTFVPKEEEFKEKREAARKKLMQVAGNLLGEHIDENAFFIATSGRYEFKNKGIDLFIDALGELNKSGKKGSEIIAFLLIPANHYGARKDLLAKMNGEGELLSGSRFLTHNLHDPEWDPILNRIKMAGLINEKDNPVKIIFVPSYLNGKDGIFDMVYYDVLIGMDLTIFPSYYEPWGYTPLESLAFSVPTVTTSLAGFGAWAKIECAEGCQGISVIERTDDNDEEVIKNIVQIIQKYSDFDSASILNARENAHTLSRTALWKTLASIYFEAYSKALKKAAERSDRFVEIEEKQVEQVREEVFIQSNEPIWKKIIVKSKLPENLKYLNELSQNLWWSWDDEAQELYETIDPELWEACEHNPAVLFEQVPYDRLISLSRDKEYVDKIKSVYNRFVTYISDKSEGKSPKIAYFSMEYGFHDSLKTYSGGLGILAGDFLKEASDMKVDIIGIGFLYRYGYFSQVLTTKGEQQAVYDFQHFSKLPLKPVRDENHQIMSVNVMLPGRAVHARIWQVDVGRVKVLLLDTDFDANSQEDRMISHNLYGGYNENRLKQELVLGIGGIRVLDVLGIVPDLFHSNEGHSAFIGFERIRKYMLQQRLSFAEAKEIVRTSTLFTTHTPVPAGHDEFEEDLMRKYIGHYPARLKISWDELMALGRSNPNKWNEKFNMSHLAAHLAQEINGVSMLHGQVTREIFSRLWPGYLPEELHIGYVTNGVHFSTWTAKIWKAIYNKYFGSHYLDDLINEQHWQKIYDVPDNEIWEAKQELRSKLIYNVKDRFKNNWIKRHEDPKQIIAINNRLSDRALTIVFARRFATYKRAHLLFRNLERLAKIVNIPDKPVQFIFAGKAHPNDKAGQDLIKMIVDISKRPEFLGRILFLQNYDIGLAKILLQGADVWLNTPTRPLEASGTSGEKAVMNGTLHFSVLDGWWVEGYQPDAGWALTNERTYEDHSFQDDLDSEIIYTIFEQEIIPAFFNRNKTGVSTEWVKFIKNSIAKVAPKFTTRRMMSDYLERYYNKMHRRTIDLFKDDYEKIKEISSWKKRIIHAWSNIEVLEKSVFNQGLDEYQVGEIYEGEVVLDLNEVSPQHVGVELVITENSERLISAYEFTLENYEVDRAFYKLKVAVNQPGTFTYGIRIFPKNPLLAYRQDIPLTRWI